VSLGRDRAKYIMYVGSGGVYIQYRVEFQEFAIQSHGNGCCTGPVFVIVGASVIRRISKSGAVQ
jgi:hypothetical protein